MGVQAVSGIHIVVVNDIEDSLDTGVQKEGKKLSK